MDAKFPISTTQMSSVYAWRQPTISNGDLSASPHRSLVHSHVNRGAAAASTESKLELEEELAPHNSFLEYINSMLMDETFEDSSWQLLAHHSVGRLTDAHGSIDNIAGKGNFSSSVSLNDQYEHIFRGFHDILDENPSNSFSFHSVETENGASEKLVAKVLESPAEFARDFSPNYYLQQPEDYLDAFQHGFSSGHMMELKSDVKNQHKEPSLFMQNGVTIPATQRVQFHKNGNRPFMPSHSLKVAEVQDISLVRNTDLPAELYAQLFDEYPLKSKEAALSSAAMASGPRRNEGRRDEALENPVDLKALLIGSGIAVGNGNVKQAMDILHQIQQEGASPHGSGLQRVVHYFCEALMARLSGMGNTLYKAIANTAQLPSPLMVIKAYKMVFEACPYVKIAYHFANQYILKVAKGARRLHIIDYGILYGFQWPCLIYALAHQHGGPPFIRITGIEFPANPADINPRATTEGTSCRLREYAKTYNVPFEYQVISASKWEDIDASSLHISQDEVVVINSFNRLGHIHDDTVMLPSPRDQLLKRMRSFNPKLFVMGSMNAGHSSPFFAPRFKEAFYYYSNMFDVLHTTMMNESPERVMFERELMGRAILNVVACEGIERVELPETYKQWQARIIRMGFRQLAILPSVLDTAIDVMKSYHKDFSLLNDSNKWLLLGWRGRSMQALSAWEPDGRQR
ncbi:hypothetical protein GOP47_0008980 [Adiantum capillus-veneris]|uniref:Uncharacterized protein n=1 Tax=Adiantum capillus-veneris TaxID=13818 RepID=A0A9D4ZL82_ADICA|nr:hypothetical protein GOP47_0008980 [Adiantum capillus-veneris]